MQLLKCPRCEWECFEKLKSHSHCFNCNYFETRSVRLPKHSPLPPIPKHPSGIAREIELCVFDNEELITSCSYDLDTPKKRAA